MGFSDEHKKIADGWHLSLSDIQEFGWVLHTAKETRQATGCDTPSIEIPYRDLNGKPIGVSRYRLADPTKVPPGSGDKERKYTTSKGAPPTLYFPDGWDWKAIAKNTKARIRIVEGERKAHVPGMPTVGISGHSGWQSKGELAAQFKDIDWTGRVVELIPDTDWRRNPAIAVGFARLGKQLKKLGAKVYVRLLPDLLADFKVGEKYKTGLDDWLYHEKATAKDFKDKVPRVSIDHPDILAWDPEAADLPATLRGLMPNADWWLDTVPPPREMIVGPYAEMGAVGCLVSEGGTGKSHVFTQMIINVATGTDFYGWTVPKPRRVLYIMLERSKGSLHRRIYKTVQAWLAELLPGPRAQAEKLLRQNLIIKHCTSQLGDIVESHNGRHYTPAAWVDQLIQEMNAAGIEFLVIETLSRLHNGDEDNKTFSAISKELERITVGTGAGLMFSHHTGKDAREGQNASRGGSALTYNTSEMLQLRLLTEPERNQLDLSALQEYEKDVVVLKHHRCSDGMPGDPIYLARSMATGLLRKITVERKLPETVLGDLLPSLRKWAEKHGPFTRNGFVTGRKTFAGEISKRDAEKLFDSAIELETFVEATKIRGYPAYTVQEAQLPSLPVNTRSTGKHAGKHGFSRAK